MPRHKGKIEAGVKYGQNNAVKGRLESQLVRALNQRREQIALHARAEPGKFTTDPLHQHSPYRHVIQHNPDYLLDRFLHHAQTVAITGRSYRLKNHATVTGKEDKNRKIKSKSDEPSTAEPAS